MLRRYGVLLLMLNLCACASIIDGSSQKITVSTNPMGADCVLNRRATKEGSEMPIARVNPTPGDVTVEKTKYDIAIVCNKPGYQPATFVNQSGNEGSTLGNIILGGGIGWAVDSANSADNKYQSPVNITMVPFDQATPYAPNVTPVPAYGLPAGAAYPYVPPTQPQYQPQYQPKSQPQIMQPVPTPR